MSVLKRIKYNGESIEEIVEKNKDADVITFSTGIGYTIWTDYKIYPRKNPDKLDIRKWVWREGEYHFMGKCEDLPSISLIRHIEIFRHSNRAMSEWETDVIVMNRVS